MSLEAKKPLEEVAISRGRAHGRGLAVIGLSLSGPDPSLLATVSSG